MRIIQYDKRDGAVMPYPSLHLCAEAQNGKIPLTQPALCAAGRTPEHLYYR